MDYWTVSCSCWRCPSPKMAVDTSSRQLKTLPISRAVVQRCVRGKVIGKLGGVSGAAVLTASSNQYLSSVLSRENLSPQGLHGAGGGRQNWYGQGQGPSEGEGVTGGGA
ncbi:uncharacterized protein LOC135333478 isoform X2 [Halichondria panicea]|uniref:uncharacterized protein LOC135333478 isoform X2 n=1 Tax=Halichondria panicea TaxID=6063 RepID=UPI00312B3894